MHVVVIADRGDDDDGYVGERLRERGGVLEVCWRDEPNEIGGPARSADCIVLLGSNRSVHDPREATVVGAEQSLVHEALERGTPLLAICYGAQLVASALGATVSRAPRAEIGWTLLELDEGARISAGPWFEYHFDNFGEIPGVSPFATSASAPQAFTLDRMLACQFHPEVRLETLELWLQKGARALRSQGVDDEALRAESAARAPLARSACHDLVDYFLDEVAGAPREGAG